MHSRNCIKETAVQVMDESWDYLIILDACRYDYFEELWRKYLPAQGNLSCRTSVGGCTVEWRDKSFCDSYKDVVYVSANPYINSEQEIKGFLGTDYFGHVVDVWKAGWDEARGTVRPETVTREALKAVRQYPGKRMIIHYLQPHAPYLAFGSDCLGFPKPDTQAQQILWTIKGRAESKKGQILFKKLLPHVKKAKWLGNRPAWMLAQLLRLSPVTPLDAVRRKHGKKGLRRAYRENLQVVLEEAARLLTYLSGRIVITSDHGELLGERNCFSHDPESENPILRQVPWYQVEQKTAKALLDDATARESEKSGSPEDGEIENRLRALGYL